MDKLDLVIIGAGQAGLAAGYYAQKAGLNFVILDANASVGDSWRQRYDSLQLFSTRSLSSLPGLKFPGRSNGYPNKNEVASYLQLYATQFQLPIRTEAPVIRLTKDVNGGTFHIDTDGAAFQSKAVIVASGGFRSTYIPPLPGRLDPIIVQLHSAQYQNPSQIGPGRVLVVGSGNSGAAIASELASSHQVDLSARSPLRFHSRHGWQKSIPYLAKLSGLVYASHTSKLGHKIKHYGIPIIGTELKKLLLNARIKLRPATKQLDGRKVIFSDGTSAEFATVIWCTGFRPNMRWIDIPEAINENTEPNHRFGVSPIPGLYYLGLHWQRSLASALIGGVGHDAQFIIDRLIKDQLE